MKPSRKPRISAVVRDGVVFAPSMDEHLTRALRDDLTEVLSALKLKVLPESDDLAPPLVFGWADVPALPPHSLDACMESLADADVVIGPCPDNSLYLLGVGESVSHDDLATLMRITQQRQCLSALVDWLEETDLSVLVLPPWFRLADQNAWDHCLALSRLAAMDELGEDMFFADRLNLWMESTGCLP